MPEPISAIGAYCLGYAALQTLARRSSGVSSEAHLIERAANSLIRSSERSQSLFGKKAAAISALYGLADECREADWDGEGSSPVSVAAVALAEQLLRALPDDVSIPELCAEPDGSVGLDWSPSRYRIFSLSVGSTNRIAYAWLDGTDRGRGVARFNGGAIPSRILEGVRAITQIRNAALRVT